jgi:ABC-type antimicrobial peptide transport system permease subunit
VLTRGFALTSIGLILGLLVAFSTTRLLGYMLYRVDPRDPLSFLYAVAVTGLAAAGACLLPALRATRTDPVIALRS